MFGWLWEVIRRLIRRLTGCGIPSVSVKPNRGPHGSTVIIAVTGLRARAAITTVIGPGTLPSTGADDFGNASITETIYGEPNEVVSINVITGSGICEQTTTLSFTITN